MRQTQIYLPLVLPEWKPFRDDSRQAYSSQMPQQDFWQSMFCTTRTLFPHLTVVPCQYHQVHWKSETTPCRNFHYLTETRVFTKLAMACVLLQGTMAAKIAHQLGILGGTEQSWGIRSWPLLWTGWKEWWRWQLSNSGGIISFPWLCVFQENWRTSQRESEDPADCWMQEVNDTLQKSQKQQS